jgi:hypothetical protein
MTKRKKNYESKKIYVPKINSPYGVSSSNSKAKNARSLASVNKTRNEKSSVEANVTLINHKNGKKATSKSPKNLNDIKRINNNKVVCNNVMIDVEGCYDPMIKLDDITESEFSMNDVENSVVGWIVKHGRGKTILGCMAWLSNKKILNCLIENAKRVLFLVNDEDYSNWPKVLRYYDRLPKFEEPLHSAFFGSKSLLRALDRDSLGNRWEVCSFEPVRCFGNSAFASKRAASLMHNKIIIFFEETRLPGGKIVETPVSFITGSYNCTDNASNNLENAVFLKSKKGAEHCFYQFSIIMSHSRPLRRS